MPYPTSSQKICAEHQKGIKAIQGNQKSQYLETSREHEVDFKPVSILVHQMYATMELAKSLTWFTTVTGH